MKNKIKITGILMLFLMIQYKAHSQAKILDLSITTIEQSDSLASDSVELAINFKISDATNASKVHFWLGTAINDSSLFVAIPAFISNANEPFLSFQGKTNKIENHTVFFYLKTSKLLYNSFAFATLFVEMNTSEKTSHLYYKK